MLVCAHTWGECACACVRRGVCVWSVCVHSAASLAVLVLVFVFISEMPEIFFFFDFFINFFFQYYFSITPTLLQPAA